MATKHNADLSWGLTGVSTLMRCELHLLLPFLRKFLTFGLSREMCCASGRDSILKRPSDYLLDLPRKNVGVFRVPNYTHAPAKSS